MRYGRSSPEEIEARFEAEIAHMRRWNARCKARRVFIEQALTRVTDLTVNVMASLVEKETKLDVALDTITKLRARVFEEFEQARNIIRFEKRRIEETSNALLDVKNKEVERLQKEADELFPDLQGKAFHNIAHWDPTKAPPE